MFLMQSYFDSGTGKYSFNCTGSFAYILLCPKAILLINRNKFEVYESYS
jgi:hypothetical protein